MTTQQNDPQSPLDLDEGETLDDLMQEIAGELLQAPLQTDAAAAKTLRLIADQLRHISGAGDTLAVIVGGELMNEQGFKTEEAARRLLNDLLTDSEPDDYYITIVTDHGSGSETLGVEMHGAHTWLEAEEESREDAP